MNYAATAYIILGATLIFGPILRPVLRAPSDLAHVTYLRICNRLYWWRLTSPRYALTSLDTAKARAEFRYNSHLGHMHDRYLDRIRRYREALWLQNQPPNRKGTL